MSILNRPFMPWESPDFEQPAPGARATPFTPPEEEGWLRKAGSAALSGLGYVGGVMEKVLGGRAIRGLLGGRPREILSLLPGSDIAGITDPSERVSGKELLEKAGILTPGQESWAGTLGGLATEMALDPGLYLGFGTGALTKAGQVAQKVGAVPRGLAAKAGTTLGEAIAAGAPELQLAGRAATAAGGAEALAPLMGERLGGVFSVGIPGMGRWIPRQVVGATPGGEEFLRTAGAIPGQVSALLGKAPLVGPAWQKAAGWADQARRSLAALTLHPEYRGLTSEAGQRMAREAGQVEDYLAADAARIAGEGIQGLRGSPDPSGSALRELVEGVAPRTPHGAADLAVARDVRAYYDQAEGVRRAVGLPVSEDPAVKFSSRQVSQPVGEAGALGGGYPTRAVPVETARLSSRDPAVVGIPGGSEAISRIGADPATWAGDVRQAVANAVVKEQGLTPQQAEPLVNWIRGLGDAFKPTELGGGGLKVYGNHTLADLVSYGRANAREVGGARAVHNLFAGTATQTPLGQALPAGHVSLSEALTRAGLSHHEGPLSLARQIAGEGASPEVLGRLSVPESSVAEATRLVQGLTQPESLTPLVRAWDYLTSLYKRGVTQAFLPYHFKQRMRGLWTNYVKGGTEPGLDPISGFIKPQVDAARLARGGVLEDLQGLSGYEGLTPAQATGKMRAELFANVQRGRMGAPSEVMEAAGREYRPPVGAEELLRALPGEAPRSYAAALRPVAEPGLGYNPFTRLTHMGENLSELVELENRGGLYLALRRQGFSPESAGQEVLGSHFNFARDGTTQFERSVLKRLIPFYVHASRNIPFHLEQLATLPGGAVGMEARLAQAFGPSPETWLPESMAGGLNVPLGTTEEGKARYLSRLGLPPEQTFEMLRGGPGGLAATARAAVSQLHPFLKGPLEYAAGTQFLTGRPLAEVYPGAPLLGEALASSPAARYLSTLQAAGRAPGAVTSPVNLLTGLRVTDVDPERERFLAERRYAESMLAAQPELRRFTNVYAPPGLETLDPQLWQLLRLQATLAERAKAAAAARRAGGVS
jgi:hypothetical protein